MSLRGSSNRPATYWAIMFRDMDNYIPELFSTRKEARERIERGASVLPSAWQGAYVRKVRLQTVKTKDSSG